MFRSKYIRSFPSLKGDKEEAKRERNNTFNNNRETAGAFCAARYQADITARPISNGSRTFSEVPIEKKFFHQIMSNVVAWSVFMSRQNACAFSILSLFAFFVSFIAEHLLFINCVSPLKWSNLVSSTQIIPRWNCCIITWNYWLLHKYKL